MGRIEVRSGIESGPGVAATAVVRFGRAVVAVHGAGVRRLVPVLDPVAVAVPVPVPVPVPWHSKMPVLVPVPVS